MSHLNFVTFQFLDIDESVYIKRLNLEMKMWNHKKELIHSPHKFIRMEAAKMTSPFIMEQEDLVKFKKEQRYSKDDREMTKKDLTTYLKRLQDFKEEVFKPINRPCTGCPADQPMSAFEFLEESRKKPASPESVCANGTTYHQTDVKAVMIFDQLCSELIHRPDQVALKLEEFGHKLSVSDLLQFNLFV